MSQAQSGDTVKVHYTGKLDDGSVFDTSTDHDPLQFVIGEGALIAGFEQGVVGMETGSSKTIDIPAAEAYGFFQEDKLIQVDREHFPPDVAFEVGQQYEWNQDGGKTTPVRVIDVSEADVTLDSNHPLVGKDLSFDIQLIEIVRSAS